MDPPSPSKLAMSPGMPLFPLSPERAAGTKPLYGNPSTPQSPSLPDLRASPLRKHRRGDSNVSGLASMFENLGIRDPKEAHDKYMEAYEKQKLKHANEIKELEKKHADAIARLEIRNEELKAAAKEAKKAVEDTVPREIWDEMRQEHRKTIGKWEAVVRDYEVKVKTQAEKLHKFHQENSMLKEKVQQYRKKNMEYSKEIMRQSSQVPTLQTRIQGLERNARIAESDLKFQTAEADKYKNMVYGLQVDLESVEIRLKEEIQTLKDKLKLVEGERDALKTSLKEEEVLRIAAEGRIPLPASTNEDEQDEFSSPVRSPRKQQSPDREGDHVNVAPRKLAVELKFAQQELAAERRLRTRAQEQIEFMKMECQFRCCSCRIADMKGSSFVHDGSYAAEMEHIKASVPEMTPPPTSHGEDMMEDVIIKDEPLENAAPSLTPPLCEGESAVPGKKAATPETSTDLDPEDPGQEPTLTFSPTSGTFRAVPSPAKAATSGLSIAPATRSNTSILSLTRESSVWAPDANSTEIHADDARPSLLPPLADDDLKENRGSQVKSRRGTQQYDIIYEDAVVSDDENAEPQTPLFGPPGPATPGQYITRTITTTTTVPLHFSPFTPAAKRDNHPLTPSTVAHAPSNIQSNALGEISLNKLPIDREAALEAIRQRRGRARSMAAGHVTPRKQMMEGVKERRDISAPVARGRR
ncbi:uncharacterized protein EI97DRAFT_407825 [Westerdykella ornata]|uniref:Uncharacterized protein n=1 Tax=Westerdykella ornata TaxID=318751 RepID=A0A6A6J6P0_WESOR|nr:uncharacterized protein EI97DRAFT_407825 [Westerdykella ornata]KAF2271638.1 hypothetical protein EI97DRAFT_407825 [Westerdykella ornata]